MSSVRPSGLSYSAALAKAVNKPAPAAAATPSPPALPSQPSLTTNSRSVAKSAPVVAAPKPPSPSSASSASIVSPSNVPAVPQPVVSGDSFKPVVSAWFRAPPSLIKSATSTPTNAPLAQTQVASANGSKRSPQHAAAPKAVAPSPDAANVLPSVESAISSLSTLNFSDETSTSTAHASAKSSAAPASAPAEPSVVADSLCGLTSAPSSAPQSSPSSEQSSPTDSSRQLPAQAKKPKNKKKKVKRASVDNGILNEGAHGNDMDANQYNESSDSHSFGYSSQQSFPAQHSDDDVNSSSKTAVNVDKAEEGESHADTASTASPAPQNPSSDSSQSSAPTSPLQAPSQPPHSNSRGTSQRGGHYKRSGGLNQQNYNYPPQQYSSQSPNANYGSPQRNQRYMQPQQRGSPSWRGRSVPHYNNQHQQHRPYPQYQQYSAYDNNDRNGLMDESGLLPMHGDQPIHPGYNGAYLPSVYSAPQQLMGVNVNVSVHPHHAAHAHSHAHSSPVPHPLAMTLTPSLHSAAPLHSARREAVRRQLEYYFSEENLVRDSYLKGLMDARGYVPITKLLEFNKLRQICGGDSDEVTAAAQASEVLKLKRGAIKLRKQWGVHIYPPIKVEDETESSDDDAHTATESGETVNDSEFDPRTAPAPLYAPPYYIPPYAYPPHMQPYYTNPSYLAMQHQQQQQQQYHPHHQQPMMDHQHHPQHQQHYWSPQHQHHHQQHDPQSMHSSPNKRGGAKPYGTRGGRGSSTYRSRGGGGGGVNQSQPNHQYQQVQPFQQLPVATNSDESAPRKEEAPVEAAVGDQAQLSNPEQ